MKKQNTKKRMKVQKFHLLVICFLVLGLLCQPVTAMAKSSKKTIQYNGKSHTYTKSAVNVVINDLQITTPFGGLILDNISMVPAYQTYKTSELDVLYQYDAKKRVLTLENLEHSVKFPVGKKYAYVDGKKRTIDHSALFVKDKKTGKTCLMVPARASAEALGYEYTWNNKTVTSSISEQEDKMDDMSQEDEENDMIQNEENDSSSSEEGTVDQDQNHDTNTDQNVGEDEEETDSGNIDLSSSYSLKIPKPQGLEFYETEDNYWEKEFTIVLDNDYTDFYNENLIEKNKSAITDITVDTNEDGNTEVVLKTSKIQAFRITEKQDGLYVESGDPKDLYEKVIVIDAGHGGSDPGMSGNGIIEKNKTLEITKAVKNYFDLDDSFKVYYTRLADTARYMTAGTDGIKNSQMSLAPRYNLANAVDADLFISIHVNSWKVASTNGTETLYSPKNTNENEWGMTSKKLAQMMQEAMVDVIGRADRGIKSRNNLAVLNNTKMPAIIIETAFATNKEDAKVLNTKVDEIAQAIYDVTVQTFE